MTLQDAHTHFFSRPFFETLAKLSPLEGTPETLLAGVSARTGLELPGDDIAAHRDRWLAEMDAAGVERMVTFASLPPEAEAVAEAARTSSGRLLGYTLVNPAEDAAPAFVEKALGSMGFRGLLLFPAMHHVHPADERCFPLYELAATHAAPVIVHCGVLVVKLRDLLGLPRPYDLGPIAHPLGVVPAANRFPNVTFVLPHFGGGFSVRSADGRHAVRQHLGGHLVVQQLDGHAPRRHRTARCVRLRTGRVRLRTDPVRHRLQHLPSGLPRRHPGGPARRVERRGRDPRPTRTVFSEET